MREFNPIYDNILQGRHMPNGYPALLSNLIKAIRDLKGAQRTDVALRMPWDVAEELMDLGRAVATPIMDPKSLDHDEDYRRREGYPDTKKT